MALMLLNGPLLSMRLDGTSLWSAAYQRKRANGSTRSRHVNRLFGVTVSRTDVGESTTAGAAAAHELLVGGSAHHATVFLQNARRSKMPLSRVFLQPRSAASLLRRPGLTRLRIHKRPGSRRFCERPQPMPLRKNPSDPGRPLGGTASRSPTFMINGGRPAPRDSADSSVTIPHMLPPVSLSTGSFVAIQLPSPLSLENSRTCSSRRM